MLRTRWFLESLGKILKNNKKQKSLQLFSENIIKISASQITKFNENSDISILLHFKDQKVRSRKDLGSIRYKDRKVKKVSIFKSPLVHL